MPVPGSAPSPLDNRDEARQETTPGRDLETLPADLTLFDGPRCIACAGPLPDGSRRDRETCSTACRQRASRQARSVTSEMGGAVGHHSGLSRAATSLRGALAAIAAAIPTPADEYGPARAYCEVREGGFGVVFGRLGGRVNEPAGPVFPRPRQAIALADLLNSPLATT